jgi:hypothetical protein
MRIVTSSQIQLLDVHGVKDATQTDTHTAEPLVGETSSLKVKIASEMLKSLFIDQNFGRTDSRSYIFHLKQGRTYKLMYQNYYCEPNRS